MSLSQHYTDSYTPSMSDIDHIQIRIIRDKDSRDGWIGRQVSKSNLDRIAYIRNLSDIIDQLYPGQVWEAQIIKTLNTVDIVNLIELIQD